jgi:hypothetical protein
MLTRVIVSSYVWLIETALWFAIALSAVVGYQFTVPVMNAAGAVLTPEFGWKLLGALLLPVVTFMVLAVATGPFLILVDIRQAVRNIDARLEREADVSRTPASERKEPSI